MDRDREGQLYLESRRQQAVQDLLLTNRASFLSTITPPSTSPSSAASSLFREPLPTSAQELEVVVDSLPPSSSNTPTAPTMTPTTPTFLNVTSPFQSFVPSVKTRRRSASQGRVLLDTSRPMIEISPSSLEYQLTANLLSYPQPPASPRGQQGSDSRPKVRHQRRATISNDARIMEGSYHASTSTGHQGHRRKRSSKDSGNPDSVEMHRKGRDGEHLESRRKQSHSEGLTPTSLPASPVGTGPHVQFEEPSSSSSEQKQHQHPLASATPGSLFPPPTSSVPQKSSRSLIAQYFPGSLPPPPSRNRVPGRNREPLVAPTPFKTPTFGPMMQDGQSPGIPSPSGSFHCIHSTSISRSSTAQPQAAHEDSEALSTSSRPSPSTSAIGLSGPPNRTQQAQHHHPLCQLSDQDSCGSHGCSHNHPSTSRNTARNQNVNNFIHFSHGRSHTTDDWISSSAAFFPISAPAAVVSPGPMARRSSSSAVLATAPVYPSPLADIRHPAILRLQQKPVPYVRELVPGKEDPAIVNAGPPSTNTSRDLEIVLEEATGRLRTNRTSIDPWSYYASTLEEKPLPSLVDEKSSRYWVFRDEQGIVLGPLFFILGHLCPILWWIGSFYPSHDHPDDVSASEHGTVEDGVTTKSSKKLGWFQKWFGATNGSCSRQSSVRSGRISQDTDREGSTFAPCHINANNGSAIQISMPPPIHPSSHGPLDRHGPWSAEDHAASLYEQRAEHDRKVMRYDLDLRWKRINLIWSVGSFVLAIAITAFVIGFV